MTRWATTIAVALAVVATALAGIKEQSESRRLQYDIPRMERRLQLLERRTLDAQAEVSALASPRSLLTELEGGAPVATTPRETPAARGRR
ncbi:MAG: hypothetical protein ACKOCB_04740 [Planctomycetia bacterium]